MNESIRFHYSLVPSRYFVQSFQPWLSQFLGSVEDVLEVHPVLGARRPPVNKSFI